MAVPRNGIMEEDDNEDENGLFEEDGVNDDLEADTPPHLRELAAAAQLGDVEALRVALGLLIHFILFFFSLFDLFCFTFYVLCKPKA